MIMLYILPTVYCNQETSFKWTNITVVNGNTINK